MPRASKTPLILVGHSMGGLVAKRAFTLAKQNEEYRLLANRVHSIVFLATPHRGSNLAQLFSKILNLSPGARPFVADLHRSSSVTEAINDEFPHYCQDLRLYSFYETMPMFYGLGRNIIVEKDLAVLGYHNERSAYLNSNHSNVCKYDSRNDPNYQVVRNALASIIEGLKPNAASEKVEVSNDDQHLLSTALGVTDSLENHFMDVDALRTGGSCQWLTKRANYLEWCDGAKPHIYWIYAKPATGKTVLSGMIINHLRELQMDLAFYFFDYRDKRKTTIGDFLLSMAWQMAGLHEEILRTVLEVCRGDEQLHKSDYRSIWRKLFLEGVLRVKLNKLQYWVIDALDECKNGLELVPLLLKVTATGSIRILLTSRNRFEHQQQATSPVVKVVCQDIPVEATKHDIALYLEQNLDQLPAAQEEDRRMIVDEILRRSADCFLWVSLIIEELRQVHTSAETRQVLENIPSDMNELYQRILDKMSMAPYGKKLAQAIITWTVCSVRPLTTDELHHALELDLQDRIDSIEKSIASSCGQLVYVDTHSKVQMIHKTARDFLLQGKSSSEFSVDGKEGHKRLALTCLRYLNSNEMKSPRQRGRSARSPIPRPKPKQGSVVNYSSHSFFDHMFHVHSTDDDVFFALAKFLGSSNVLSWIEHMAQQSSLQRLMLAGKAFRNFLQRRSHHLSPFGREVALLDSWATDLVRLVTKFGKYLLEYPSSIFHHIPPFCPSETALRRQLTPTARGIVVLGLSERAWDDCMSTIVNQNERCSALACSRKNFAVGMSSGRIFIYDGEMCQEQEVIQHQEQVRILQFGERCGLLASAGFEIIRLWNVNSWTEVWSADIAKQCLSVAFYEECQLFFAALRNNNLMIWDLETGAERDSIDWTLALGESNSHAYRRPICAAFSEEAGLLAVVYRGQDIVVWDIERDAIHGTYCKETGAYPQQARRSNQTGASSVLFGVEANPNLLAVSYADGDLVLFDLSLGTRQASTLANSHSLACSHDGRTLACADSSGTIQLFEFDTLRLLYRIHSGEHGCQGLAFSGDNNRLLDISGSQCRVWDPTVLLRQDDEEDNSDTMSISTGLQEVSVESSDDDVVLVTSIACHPNEDIVFCGKEDGSVCLYDTKSGQQSQKLYSHAMGVSVLSISLNGESNIITSLDSSSRLLTQKLTREQQQDWIISETLFDHRTETAVDQVLMNSESTRLLVCTAERDTLWSISSTEGPRIIAELSWKDRGAYRWGSHPIQHDHLILISNNIAHLYDWKTLSRVTGPQGILLESDMLSDLAVRSIVPCFANKVIAIAFGKSLRHNAETQLLLWDPSDFTPGSKSATPVPQYRPLSEHVKDAVGEYRSQLVFLHSSGWVCTATPQSSVKGTFARHFFLPTDWLSTNVDLLFGVNERGDFVFVRRHEVAVVKNGLETAEPVLCGRSSRRRESEPHWASKMSEGSRRTSSSATLVVPDEQDVDNPSWKCEW
ncbi:MAG: hypothetical protein M1831_003721 [Alyxoria varia]|nr:MAG: hypothetical protein M1831_003721 [Alyxoria varia]